MNPGVTLTVLVLLGRSDPGQSPLLVMDPQPRTAIVRDDGSGVPADEGSPVAWRLNTGLGRMASRGLPPGYPGRSRSVEAEILRWAQHPVDVPRFADLLDVGGTGARCSRMEASRA